VLAIGHVQLCSQVEGNTEGRGICQLR
jgi:hypothetical protein